MPGVPTFDIRSLLVNSLAPAASGAVTEVIDFRPYDRIESLWVRGNSVLSTISFKVYLLPGITSTVGRFNDPSTALYTAERFMPFASLPADYELTPDSITTENTWIEITPNAAVRSPFVKFLVGVTGGSATDQRIDMFGYFRKSR